MAQSYKKVTLFWTFALGSKHTSAVAHKMGRKWIGIEQMDYIENGKSPYEQKSHCWRNKVVLAIKNGLTGGVARLFYALSWRNT